MKIKEILSLVLLGSSILFSCNNTEHKEKAVNNYTVINGSFDIPYLKAITLSKIEHGKEIEIATSTLNSSKQYGFNIASDKEGFYILGTEWIKIPIYVKNNQVFNIDVSTTGYVQYNIPDDENKILYDWVHSNDTLLTYSDFRRRDSKTYEEFFPFYEKHMVEMSKFHKKVNTKNERFNRLMNVYIDTNIDNIALTFIFTPRMKHPAAEDMAPFYHEIMKENHLNSTDILDVPKGLRTLAQLQLFKSIYINDDLERKQDMIHGAKNDTLKGYLILNNIDKYEIYDEKYHKFIDDYRDDIALSTYVTKKVDEYELTMKKYEIGFAGYNFKFNDINGKKVSFSDFKGKYVYIDFWAMWCSPCKKEIPALKQLEKDLHGKNIEFVSISMDKPKELEKWKKFVSKEGLSGIQLFSDNAFETRVAKEYKINSIPRFMLFDKEGNVVNTKAMRPRDPELKPFLLKLL